MPLTAAERQKNYRERLKINHPEKWKEIKDKDAEKKRKKYKKICELSESEKVVRRRTWRKLKEKQFEQKERVENKISRKVYKQRYYKITKENKQQKIKIDRLKKKVDSLRKQVYRYKLLACKRDVDDEKENINSSISSRSASPVSKTESFIRELKDVPSPEKEKVRKVILERYGLSESLANTYKSTKTNAERNVIKGVINNSLVQKYKMKTRLGYCVGLKGRARNTRKQINTEYVDVAEIIRRFYLQDDVSRATAGKKETKTKNKVKMQRRYLLDSLTNLCKKFREDTRINVSYTTFLRNKPFYVISPTISNRDTCLCKKHSNINFKFASLKRLSVFNTHISISELVKSLVCNPQSQINVYICVMYSQCAMCKGKNIKYDFTKFTPDEKVSWLEWSIKDVKYQKDNIIKTSKRYIKEIKTGSLGDLLSKFEQELYHFKIHSFNISHQYNMYKDVKDNLKNNEILLHCDFSENYTCKMYQEIQAVHFGASQFQITLHTSVLYQKNKKPQCYCTFSDSSDHSPAAIWAHLKPILSKINKEAPDIDTIHFFSGGPATQYRQKKNFFLFNKLIKYFDFTGTWNFFEAAHGKGAADGVGGTIKRLLDSKVAHGNDILNAESACSQLMKETSIKLFYIDEKDIESIMEDNINSLGSLVAVPKTMQVHQIQTTNESNIIVSRILSCFCARSASRGFCDCFFAKRHKLIKAAKRTKIFISSSEESQEDESVKILPIKRATKSGKSNISPNPRVTILSDIRVDYSRETLQTLVGSSKRYNMSTNDLKKNLQELILDEPLPSTSKTDFNNYFDLSDDSDYDIF